MDYPPRLPTRAWEQQRERDGVASSSSAARQRHHFPADPNVVYRAIDPNEVILPGKVIACLEGGMQRYIPLTLLTSKACRDASRTAAMDKDVRHTLKLEDGDLRMAPSAFDATGEEEISVTEWIDTSARYVKLLGRYLLAGNDAYVGGPDAQRIAAEWGEHFRLIRERPTFTEQFKYHRRYDICVRRTWQSQLTSKERWEAGIAPNQVIRPDMWHNDLYKQIVEEALLEMVASVALGSSKMGYTPSGTGSSITPRSQRPSTETGHGRRKEANDIFTVRCMYCGKKDHHYRHCHGEEGLPIQRNKEKRWCDKDGKTYCIRFNGPAACTRGETCGHVHACTLCLGGDHGAQRCRIR